MLRAVGAKPDQVWGRGGRARRTKPSPHTKLKPPQFFCMHRRRQKWSASDPRSLSGFKPKEGPCWHQQRHRLLRAPRSGLPCTNERDPRRSSRLAPKGSSSNARNSPGPSRAACQPFVISMCQARRGASLSRAKIGHTQSSRRGSGRSFPKALVLPYGNKGLKSVGAGNRAGGP